MQNMLMIKRIPHRNKVEMSKYLFAPKNKKTANPNVTLLNLL